MSEFRGSIKILTRLNHLKTICYMVPYLLLLLVLSSCAGYGPVEPNQPYQGDFPISYRRLVESNPLLAKEVAKLPEIIDGVSASESAAIEELVELYFSNTTAFEEAFIEMYRVGIPEVRQYCTPLQALFWLAQDDDLVRQTDLLTNYNLYELLRVSWDFSVKPEINSLSISEEKASEIVSAIDKDVIWYAKNQQSAVNTLILCYTRSPSAIPKQYIQFLESIPEVEIANSKFHNNKRRWSDPYVIVDRLNSIELLDYYIDKNIQYSFGRPNYADPISYTIRTKSGGCDELALLGQTALNRAGYKTEARRIGSDSELHVGLVVKLDDGKYILAVNFKTSNVVTGPHNSLYEADQALGYRPSMGYRGSFNFHRWE